METHLYLTKIIILIALGAILHSCKSTTDSMPTYLLKTVAEPIEAGTVTPGQGAYEQGENIQLTATPHQHWVFMRWEGDLKGTGNPATIAMDSDKDISALFVKREYPLNLTIQGEGTVTESIAEQKATDYEGGTMVQLAATAGEGWHFARWEGDLQGSENPATIGIDEEKTVTAVFEKTDFTLSIEVVGEGSVTEEVVQAKSTDYPYQTEVKLTAVPAEGWEFSHWEGGVSGSQNPVQITIENDVEVTAVFIRQYFTITITYEGPGMTYYDLISGKQSDDGFEYESVVSIRVQPMEGWEFLGWQGDLSGSANPIEVTVTGNITATAVLGEVPFEGEGTLENPYRIATLEQLNAIRGHYLDDHFLQVADIDASETAGWRDGVGFVPIAFTGSGTFTGSYDGGGYSISELHIDLTGGIYTEDTFAGLFGRINNAYIKNLTLSDVEIISVEGIVGTGALAGFAGSQSIIENVEVTGSISGHNNIGGLVGYADQVAISGSSTDVTVSGNFHVGGLAGYTRLGWMSDSHSRGSVSGYQGVGGLIGNRNVGELIISSSATGDINGTVNVGGLIGSSFNTIAPVIQSYATGNVSGEQNVGGLIGFYTGTGSVYQTYATGHVGSANGMFVGGLFGRLTGGELSKSYALGNVSGNTGVGGVVGRNDADGVISEVYSVGLVTGTQSYGGLIGSHQGVLTNSYWNTETSGLAGPVWDPYQGTTNATGLTTVQMIGSNAQGNMPDFDWVSTWNTSTGYPVLQALPPSGSKML